MLEEVDVPGSPGAGVTTPKAHAKGLAQADVASLVTTVGSAL